MQLNRNSSLGSITAYAAQQAKALADKQAASTDGRTAGEMAANGANQLARAQAAGRTAGEMAASGANQLARAQAAGRTAGEMAASGANQLARAQVDQFKNCEVNPFQSSPVQVRRYAVGAVLTFEAMQAKNKLDQTIKDATSDGHISAKERQDINAAGRKLDIAETRVDLHKAGRAHRSAVADALRDRRITPEEGKKIRDAQNKIEQLDAKLKGPDFRIRG